MGCAPGDLTRHDPEEQPVVKGFIGVVAIVKALFLSPCLTWAACSTRGIDLR